MQIFTTKSNRNNNGDDDDDEKNVLLFGLAKNTMYFVQTLRAQK